MRMKCPSSSLLIDFSLKSNLLDIRNATLACFLGPFDWKVFSHPFTLRYHLSLKLRCVSCKQQKDGFCFRIHSVSLYLFMGKLRLLTFRDINDCCSLVLVCFGFIVGGVIVCGFYSPCSFCV